MASEPVVFVVDDDAAVRDSLRWVLESAGYRVETYETARGFLDAYDAKRFGCLVLDVCMPEMSGLELQKELSTRAATLPIIFVSAHGTVPTAVRAMRNGAVDFIMKPFNNQSLLDRIESCMAQGRQAHAAHIEREAVAKRRRTLTPREAQVMSAVVKGLSNKEIAAALGVSVKTVEAHRAHIMEKMRAGSLAELVRMAVLLDTPSKGKP